MNEPLAWILATGARGPLGLSSAQIAMCVRAAKMEPTASRFLDRRGEAIGLCHTSALPETLWGHDRLLRLAAPALCEAWPLDATTPTPLVLALPEAGRADDDPRFDHGFVRELAARSRRPIDLERSRTIRAGNAGFALAIEAATALLALPGGPATVMVGGVDGHVHPEVLADLDRALRLHAPGTEDGFIPSEGAAFVLLSRRPPARGSGPALAAIRRVLTGREATVGTDEPAIAAAMTAIFHALGQGDPVRWVLSDLNGESHRLREWTLVEARAQGGGAWVHDELVGELGDVGSATGALLTAIACEYFAAGCAPATSVVIALASDGAERGALQIEAIS